MSYINEFPHTDFYGSDLRELLAMYKKLSEEYDTIVSNYNQLIHDFNELEKHVSKTTSELVAKVNVEVNRAIKVMNDNLSMVEKVVYELESYVNKESEVNRQYVIDKTKEVSRLFTISISSIERQISVLNDRLIHKYTLLESATRLELAELKKYVENTTIGKIRVINPVDEKLSDLQLTLSSLHYNLKSWSLRAMDYDRLHITANEYDNALLDAWNYDYLSKWWLKELVRIDKKPLRINIFNPISGMEDDITNVVSMMISMISFESLTVNEFEQLYIDSESFDMKNISAYEYDWKGKVVLI